MLAGDTALWDDTGDAAVWEETGDAVFWDDIGDAVKGIPLWLVVAVNVFDSPDCAELLVTGAGKPILIVLFVKIGYFTAINKFLEIVFVYSFNF